MVVSQPASRCDGRVNHDVSLFADEHTSYGDIQSCTKLRRVAVNDVRKVTLIHEDIARADAVSDSDREVKYDSFKRSRREQGVGGAFGCDAFAHPS